MGRGEDGKEGARGAGAIIRVDIVHVYNTATQDIGAVKL